MQSYPKFLEGVREMARKEALKTRTARSIARKAGLRQGTVEAGPATLIDATLSANFLPLQWQWRVDLSSYPYARMDARGNDHLYAHCSLDTSAALDPGDWQLITGTYTEGGGAGSLFGSELEGQDAEPLRWLEIDGAFRAPVRVCFAPLGGPSDSPVDVGGPAGVFVQGLA